MRIVVGVLRGGPSHEYDVSLKTGASVLGTLDKEKYEPRDVFIDREGQWHLHGVPLEPERALRGVDVAFNALHGPYGEDGQVQRLLDALGVRYTGSGAYAAATASNKHAANQAAVAVGIKVPHGAIIDADKITDLEATALRIFRSLPQPSLVTPVGGRSVGATLADNYHALVWALHRSLEQSKKVLVEEFIKGRQATVGVIDKFRNEERYALVPHPDIFSLDEKVLLTTAAKRVHEGLGLAHYSQVHLTLGPRGLYFAGVAAAPYLHDDSTLNQSLQAVGAPLPHFLDHVIMLAHNG
jgi:D-alanine-D-alanine ligase